MNHALSRSAMRRVTPAKLEELAGEYRAALAEAATEYGRETNV